MAVVRSKLNRVSATPSTQPFSLKCFNKNVQQFVAKYLTIKYAKQLLFDPSKLGIVTWFILVAELILNVFVVQRVRYTEIDWIAYMQECEGFLNGTTNYAELKGNRRRTAKDGVLR